MGMCKELIFGSRREVFIIIGIRLEGEAVGRDDSLCLVRILVNFVLTLVMKGKEDEDMLVYCIFKVFNIVLGHFVVVLS